MNYLEFDFDTINNEQVEILVALLNEQGFEGFEEEEDCLKAFIPENAFAQAGFDAVIEKFTHISYSSSVVAQTNWNQRWERDFKPVLVDDFAGIRADFHERLQNVAHEIVITPKMSFGTGHHATTYMVISLMRSLDFTAKKVLDFGTGTGVLAILAEQLGAADTLAIDYDEWSITNAQENIERNGCSKIRLHLLDAVPEGESFDIILANINLNIITLNLNSIYSVTADNGYIVLSGFLKNDENAMKTALEAAGITYLSTIQRGDWIAITAKKDK